ncbi:MAG: 6-carboxytetrahydropterin synthase QueD [Desulfovibrio sp.]|nr:MAG: 6-carboxytetrahydropterin synthase QueD [Desulfovibrio sp.]
MSGIYRLTVRSEFCAAHHLRNYQGKCEAAHGHNFAVEVVVEGTTLDPDTGMLLDFGDLKRFLKDVLATLDHKDLNQVPPFTEINPSSEHLARYIFQELGKQVAEYGVTPFSVTVAEKSIQSATYMEP